MKITAFGIGGWIAGLAGGLFVGLVTRVQPGDFPAAESLRVISIVVIGGLSSVTGAVLGAFWVVGLPKLFGDSVEIGLLTSGAGLLILLLYFPGGLAQVLYSVRDNAFAFLARRLPEPEPAPVERQPLPAHVSVSRREIPASLDAVIRVEQLSVSFGPRVVVDHVDLHVAPGEVVGLIGANGAGKSTLMNAIGGFVRSRGAVEILGHDVHRFSPARRARDSASVGRSKARSCSRT